MKKPFDSYLEECVKNADKAIGKVGSSRYNSNQLKKLSYFKSSLEYILRTDREKNGRFYSVKSNDIKRDSLVVDQDLYDSLVGVGMGDTESKLYSVVLQIARPCGPMELAHVMGTDRSKIYRAFNDLMSEDLFFRISTGSHVYVFPTFPEEFLAGFVDKKMRERRSVLKELRAAIKNKDTVVGGLSKVDPRPGFKDGLMSLGFGYAESDCYSLLLHFGGAMTSYEISKQSSSTSDVLRKQFGLLEKKGLVRTEKSPLKAQSTGLDGFDRYSDTVIQGMVDSARRLFIDLVPRYWASNKN